MKQDFISSVTHRVTSQSMIFFFLQVISKHLTGHTAWGSHWVGVWVIAYRNGCNLPHSGKEQHFGTTALMTEFIPWLLLGEQCQGLAGRKVVPVFVSGDWALNNMLHSSPPIVMPKQIIFGFLLLSTEQNLTAWDITLSGSFWDCSHDHEIPFIKWVNIRSYHLGSEKTLALERFMAESIWFGLPYAV